MIISEKNIIKRLPSDEKIYNLAELFKVFGDSTRTKILCLLSISEMTVTEIANNSKMTASAVSHQLRVLKASKLVRGRKEGKEVIYALDDSHVMSILNCGLDHIKEKQ